MSVPEDLVDNIPLQDLALVVGDDIFDVVLDDRRQGVAVVDRRHPAGQLRVPEESVAAHGLAILLGEGDDLVSVGKVERSAGCYMRSSVSVRLGFQYRRNSRSSASHFMLFSHVICPKVFLTMVVKGALVRW
jgi:hypothetical protein